MLMKLTPGVTFTKIQLINFMPISFGQKYTNKLLSMGKLCITLSYADRKMLEKVTSGSNLS